MQITTVTVARLINLGNYENLRLEATATVGPDEPPEYALVELEGWIDEQARERGAKPGPTRRMVEPMTAGQAFPVGRAAKPVVRTFPLEVPPCRTSFPSRRRADRFPTRPR